MPFPTAFVMKDSGPDLGDGPVPEDGDRRRFSFPAAGLKPIADELPLAALREARLNGFAEALAVVPRHRNAGRRQRVSDPPPPSLSDAPYEDKPAYPLSYNGAGEGLAPAPPSNPPLFALPRRSRMGAPPPFPRVGAA